ncbi:DNA METHYLASE-TYPE I RESTRICTION-MODIFICATION SYSTEM [uncultured Candidatus Thioglobus sp.]|nr:DNA METHYLASE-TYPE I RESTRICTION-MODIFICATION SYSTEM [uncultured Candidatus Thioglobus sp.]
MAQISIIQKADISEAGRFDAEYFKPEYAKLKQLFTKINTKPLLSFLEDKIITGHTPSMSNDANYGGEIKFIKTDNLRVNFIKSQFNHYLSNAGDEVLNKTRLKKNDILITIIGATEDVVGRVAMIDSDILPANINQNIALIRVDKNKINPYFLNIFLNSKYGRGYLHSLARQTGQVNLNCREVEKVLIPNFHQSFQSEIEKTVKEAHQKQSQAKQLYQEAEALLLEELGLVDYQPQHRLTFDALKSEVKEVERFDSEYFQPKYFDIINKIENYSGGFDVVKNLLEFNNKNFFPKNEEFYHYVPLSKVSKTGEINIDKQELGIALPTRARRLVKTGEFILSSISGSLETSAIISKEHNNFIVSNGFYVFSSENINPETLLILFKSKIMITLLQRISKGAILGGYDLTAFEKLKIPLIKPSIQTQIAEKITQSHTLRKQSKELLELAKLKVEQEIERN